ncbi:MAG: trypsin-like peptidase domain-containing protein [Candidatus Rokubacteria bacterium]|nr:trypsin-like peptidase domain-containing protein [Candidatus Rokubacteria bacterium]
MRRALIAASLIFLPAVAAAQTDLTVQEVLLRGKPAVALVVSEVAAEVTLRCPSGSVTTTPPPFRETGTGWFISPNGWMMTNAHVVSPAHRPPDWLRAQLAEKAARPGCRPVSVKLAPSISVILSNGVRLPATVAKYSPPVAGEEMSGQDLALLRLEAADMPALSLGDSNAAKIGDSLHIVGFPGVVLTHELLNASTKVEASVTNGSIAGFKQDKADQPVIQTDAPAAWGNSGGPAVNHEGRVIGVLTFVTLSPGEQGTIVQGFNFVIPSQAVRDFLQGTEVKLDEPSRFNQAWHAGLRQFFTGDYQRADKSFAEANRLMPELPDVMRVAAENRDKIKNPPPRPFPWALVAGGVTTLSLGAYGTLLGLRWKRNRFRIKPSEVVRLLDTSEPPVLLDVRDTKTYDKSPVRIPNSMHITPQDLEHGVTAHRIEPNRTVVAYCT